MLESDQKFMQVALNEALKAARCDEVPIGAVVVRGDAVVARAFNKRNQTKSACAHAEVLAINKACKKLGDWRLTGCTLYVTLEPCLMCLGACYNARIDRVVFGAFDQNSGAVGKQEMCSQLNTLNHTLQMEGGILGNQCSQILSDYFKAKRK